MIITITQEDIDEGQKSHGGFSTVRRCQCPLAIAMRRATGKRVFIGGSNYSFNGTTWMPLPIDAQDFVERADRQKPICPCSIDFPEL